MAIVIGDENVHYPKMKPIMNYTLILLNIIIYIIGNLKPELLYPNATTYNDIVETLGFIPARIVEGTALYTFITSMFLHASLTHLFGNMLFLYIFGDNIEFVMGSKKYLLFYILSGIGASIVYTLSMALTPISAIINAVQTTGINPWLIPAIGASGAISGVLGAYMLFFPQSELVVVFLGFPVPLRLPAVAYIIFWFLYQLILGLTTLITGLQAGIAFWAHIGGFLTGMALATLFADKDKVRYASLHLT